MYHTHTQHLPTAIRPDEVGIHTIDLNLLVTLAVAALLSGRSAFFITTSTSAIPMSISAAALTYSVSTATGRVGVGILAGGVFALNDAVWSNATSAGVSGVAAMLHGGMVLLAAVASQLRDEGHAGASRARTILVMWGLVAGMSVLHQHALALTAVPLTVYLATLPAIRNSTSPSVATYALLAFASGAVPHLVYLPMELAGTFPGQGVWSHMLARGSAPLFHTLTSLEASKGMQTSEI
jgi:hypothetical protein